MALVTGEAQGIGQAIAVALAERGAQVIATDLTPPHETVNKIGANGTGSAKAEGDGVYVISPQGVKIGKILLPEICANLCFGGTRRNRLFMAASQSMYSLYVDVKGANIA